jgi:hypothetical protein
MTRPILTLPIGFSPPVVEIASTVSVQLTWRSMADIRAFHLADSQTCNQPLRVFTNRREA